MFVQRLFDMIFEVARIIDPVLVKMFCMFCLQIINCDKLFPVKWDVSVTDRACFHHMAVVRVTSSKRCQVGPGIQCILKSSLDHFVFDLKMTQVIMVHFFWFVDDVFSVVQWRCLRLVWVLVLSSTTFFPKCTCFVKKRQKHMKMHSECRNTQHFVFRMKFFPVS